MATISLKMDKKGSSFLKGIQKALLPATKNALKEGGKLIKRNIGAEIRSFASSSKGKLDNSFKIKVKRAGKGGISKITVPSRLPYAGIHQDGGTIKPKKQFLVPPFPRKASSAFSIEEMITSVPPDSKNWIAASTFGPMLPSGKCPSFRYLFASFEVTSEIAS